MLSEAEKLQRIEKWDHRFLALAEHVAQWSKDPSTKVGSVVVDPETNRVVSLGYNGFPRGIDDRPDWLANRELKLKITLHGEINAIVFAERSVKGFWLYCWPFPCCVPCTSLIIQVGIARVIAPASDNPRWKADFEMAKDLLNKKGVILKLY